MRYQRDFEPSPRRSRSATRYARDYGPGPNFWPSNPRGYDGGFSSRPRQRYGGDYWWMGERAMPQNFGGPYDEAYRRFSRSTHPRYSPVGGLQPGQGGGYSGQQSRRHSRENARFSDWTRWF